MAIFNKKKEEESTAPPRVSPLILQILRECIHDEVQATLLWSDLMHLSKGTFIEVDEETFALANPTKIKTSLLDPSLPITVTFHHLGRVFSFVTWFVLYTQQVQGDQEEANRAPWLVLQVPTRIAATDSRTAARIKVLPSAPFRAEIMGPDDKGTPVKAKEISLTGITLEVEGKDPDFKLDSKVVLKMGMEEEIEPSREELEAAKAEDREPEVEVTWHPIKIESVIRAKDPGNYNLYFPVCLTAEGIKPPQPLRQLVMALERVYLRHRAEMEEMLEEE